MTRGGHGLRRLGQGTVAGEIQGHVIVAIV